MAGAASLAKLTSLWMSDVSTTSPTKAFSYERFLDGAFERLIDTGQRTNWGTLSKPKRRVRKNVRGCRPVLDLVPNVTEWTNLLKWVQCGNTSSATVGDVVTTTYPLANTALERTVTQNDGFRTIDLLRVAVDRATLRGNAQQEITLALDCVGIDWATPSSYTPTAGRDTLPSFIFSDLTFSVDGGSAFSARNFELSVFKAIPDRFFNSAIMPGTITTDRVVTFRAELPWGLHYALWQAGADDAGVEVILDFTAELDGATYTLRAEMPAVAANTNPLDYRVGDEVFLPWETQAFSPDGGSPSYTLTDELTFKIGVPA